MSALIPVKSAARSTNDAKAVSVAPKLSVPIVIQNGIQDLLVGFQAGGSSQPAEDRIRSLQLYAQACSHVESFVSERALQQLLFHNPRNPFPPTPQDVYEICEKVERTFRCAVDNFFIGDGAWARKGSSDVINDLGPAPDQEGCIVSRPTICLWLREYIQVHNLAEELRRFLAVSFRDISNETRFGMSPLRLVILSDTGFARVPSEAFPDGLIELLKQARSTFRDRKARCEAWLAGTPSRLKATPVAALETKRDSAL